MNHFVGIDLGTTNSAICSYDGQDTRIWKSPEQNDVTPSAIYIDRRGNKYVGKRAYDSAPHSPDSAATLFKRLVGTNTPVKLPAVNLTMSPEECSAEVLRTLFGYLPEDVRNDPDTGTVITVPAAFNQMQKNATMQAADHAGIGRVALMQEPVAAVMSVMNARKTDGTFVIFDLGGGTLDIALAESIGGRVNLLAHGGIAMCGGRDFDRLLVDNVVKPWLRDNFDLPGDFSSHPDFKGLMRLAVWAVERAKIELSSREDAVVSLSEMEARTRDQAGEEVYIDIPVSRVTLNELIDEKVEESVEAAREVLAKAGLSAHDVERLVFIGGPTNYKPLRDKVSFELGIPATAELNPMTAVAEGAALFAESIDWASESRGRKSNRAKLSSTDAAKVSFNYTSRTPDNRAKIIAQVDGEAAPGAEFQIDNLDTGWTSGRLPLNDGATVDVALSRNGDNTFKVFVFELSGKSVRLEQEQITVTRTAATVDAIPASHYVGIEASDRMGGKKLVTWIVKAGDQLPKRGSVLFKAESSVKAGSSDSLNFRLYEGDGDSDEPGDNRLIGQLKVTGADFEDGVIAAGAALECGYEMLDSGAIILEVSVPSIGGTFNSGRNFYSWQEDGFDFSTDAARQRVAEESERTLRRLDELSDFVQDPKLDLARRKLESAAHLEPAADGDTERAQEAMEGVLDARKLLSRVRKSNLRTIRQIELRNVVDLFNGHLREYARPSEETAFDNLVRTAERSIENNGNDFEICLNELSGKNFEILWRQDWFVVEKFKYMSGAPHRFSNMRIFEELVKKGITCLEGDDIDSLREVVVRLSELQIEMASDADLLDVANIIRG